MHHLLPCSDVSLVVLMAAASLVQTAMEAPQVPQLPVQLLTEIIHTSVYYGPPNWDSPEISLTYYHSLYSYSHINYIPRHHHRIQITILLHVYISRCTMAFYCTLVRGSTIALDIVSPIVCSASEETRPKAC